MNRGGKYSKAIMSFASISTKQTGRCSWRPVDARLFTVSRKVFAEAIKDFYEVNVFSIDTNHSKIYQDIPPSIRQSTIT